MNLSKYKNTIKEIIDSFLQMCDYIEETDNIGCGNCPIFNECCHRDKHKGLLDLMNELGISKTQGMFNTN